MIRFASFRDLLAHQNQQHTALLYHRGQGVLSCTFEELLKRIEEYELPEENVVGLFAENTVECIVALFAIAGKRRLVLLNPHDPTATLQAQIQAAHVERLIGNETHVNEFQSFLSPLGSAAEPDILFFTSGTTSKAKAVILTESSLCSAAYNGGSLLPLTPEDTMICLLPLSHVFGFVCSLLWPLSFGASVALSTLHTVFDDFSLYHPTVATLVPQMAGFLAMRDLFNPELKLTLIGAGNCPDEIMAFIKSKGIRLSYGYGLTETSSGIALSLGDNPRAMTVCPDYALELAEDGEILVRSEHTLMKGYLDDQAATEDALRDGYLHTGDLGKLVEGKLFITGRKKETLVFDDGSKIFLPEFEHELSMYLGEGSDFAITLDSKHNVTLYINQPKRVEKKVDEFNTHVPFSHRITRIVYALAPLPRTQTGKVQRYLIPAIN